MQKKILIRISVADVCKSAVSSMLLEWENSFIIFMKCTFSVTFLNLMGIPTTSFLLSNIHLSLSVISCFELAYALHMGVDCNPLHLDMR